MFSRPTREIRLCTRRMDVQHIPGYLEDIGWPGHQAELRKLLTELTPLVDTINLDVSLEDTIVPTLGLECFINGSQDKLRRYLKYLVDIEAALPEKSNAIFQWLGFCSEESAPQLWPRHLLKASQAAGPQLRSTFVRTFNHAKIVYQPGSRVHAKVYLGARHLWLRPGQHETSP